jgi:hypothetical protein
MYAVLAAIGVLTGTVGSFLVPERLGRFGAVAAVIAVVGNLVAGGLGGLGTGRRAGAVAPFVGWVVAVGLLVIEPVTSRGGDVVIPGELANAPGVVHAGYAFLVAGVVGSVVPILLTYRYTERMNPPKSIS